MKIIKHLIFTLLFFSCGTTTTDNSIKVDQALFEIDGDIDNYSVSINIRTETEWVIEHENIAWLSFDKLNGIGSCELELEIQKNISNEERQASFIIKSVKEPSVFCKIELVQSQNTEYNVINKIEDNNFKTFLIEKIFNGNAFVSKEDAEKITEINCVYQNIHNLEGIEIFTSLSSLDCSFNRIETLDLKENIKLKELICDFNSIQKLSLDQNVKLQILDCGGNEMETLDLKNNIELLKLNCSLNNLTHLDLRFNLKLKELFCLDNLFKEQSVLLNSSIKNIISRMSPRIDTPIYNWEL